MRGRVRRTAFPALALLGLPALAGAQVRAGAEFRVNSYTTGYQYARVNAVAASTAGRFVVVWESAGRDGSGYAAMASRFDVNGTRLGTDFIANTYTTNNQYFAAVGMNGPGRFVVAWQSYTQDGSREGAFAQRYDKDGLPTGAEFRVNTFTTHTQSRSSVGLDSAGNVVIAWRSGSGPAPQDGDASGVYAQRYNNSGGALGVEFQVNTYTTEYQNRPDVARVADGTFVVAWQSYDQEGVGSGYGVYAQRYAADGVPLGPEFRVNTYTTGDQARPSVAVDGTGNFVVAWTEYAVRDGSGSSIRAQRYNAAGSAAGAEFQINSGTTGYQYQPQVGLAADGAGFVIAWNSYTTGGIGVQARKFSPNGTAAGPDFLVNTYVTGAQYTPSVAVDAVGNFMVTWNSATQDGSLSGVYAQRFGGLGPALLRVDTGSSPGTSNDNTVWEPGEEVDVRPSWRNVTGSNQPGVAGVFSDITGPAGATYTITDGAATTGRSTTTPPTSAPELLRGLRQQPHHAPRPALGRLGAGDAESGRPGPAASAGAARRRQLHRRARHEPVLPLRRDAASTTASPAAAARPTTAPPTPPRATQMAVFVLVAKEGAGYVPPACGTPVFSDVPASSPFCRCIEELARRGVVSGCGAGTVLPGQPP